MFICITNFWSHPSPSPKDSSFILMWLTPINLSEPVAYFTFDLNSAESRTAIYGRDRYLLPTSWAKGHPRSVVRFVLLRNHLRVNTDSILVTNYPTIWYVWVYDLKLFVSSTMCRSNFSLYATNAGDLWVYTPDSTVKSCDRFITSITTIHSHDRKFFRCMDGNRKNLTGKTVKNAVKKYHSHCKVLPLIFYIWTL